MNKNYYPNFNAPPGFQEILHDFAREALRYQPEDIVEFGADYFESLCRGESLEKNPKYRMIVEDSNKKRVLKSINSMDSVMKVEMLNTTEDTGGNDQKNEASMISNGPKSKDKLDFFNDSHQIHSISTNEPSTVVSRSIKSAVPLQSSLKGVDEEKDEHSKEKTPSVKSSNEEELTELESKPKEEISKRHGILKINVVNLRWEGPASDYKVSLRLRNLTQEKSLTTSVVRNSSSPTWYFQGKMMFNLPEESEKDVSLMVLLQESDVIGDTVIGSKEIPLTDVFADDSRWAFNSYVELEPRIPLGKMMPPMLYLQMRWLWANVKYTDWDSIPVDVNDIEKTIVQPLFTVGGDFFQGVLHVIIVKARNFEGLSIKDCDPFCEFWLSHQKTKRYRTEVVLQGLTPLWMQSFRIDVENLRKEELDFEKLIVCLKNSNFTHDDFLGGLTIRLKELWELNGEWKSGWMKLENEICNRERCGEVYLEVCLTRKGQVESAPPRVMESQKSII